MATSSSFGWHDSAILPADNGKPVAQWCILPTDGGYPVARAGALRRPREQSAEWQNFPEAMLRICPGYHPADSGYPVARAGALHRPREQSAEGQNFPEAMLRICPGYHPAGSGKPVAPVRRQPTPGRKPSLTALFFDT
ncbi:hypothetical protein [Klebsiella spallanzanii]|uniref:hypothetical protein n=1 Tax=Klebsiella spallanzanii TaxID=2587528 RepID=UPI00115AC40B|nr:hypothetical protein [Klebsiella spallanzanii]